MEAPSEDCIKVAVHIRPLVDDERFQGCKKCLTVVEGSPQVQLQQKIKQEAERFRQWKASHEKEVQQLKKEGRRNQYERHKLQALNQRQKMVLQRKTEEAAIATKRLKELFEVRKSTTLNNLGTLVEELAMLKQADRLSLDRPLYSVEKNGHFSKSPTPPNARLNKFASFENMVSTSSDSIAPLTSLLPQTDEFKRHFIFPGRWNLLRSMGDEKKLLQYIFNVATDARCRLWEKEVEIKEMKMKLDELVTLLQQSEAHAKEIVKDQAVGMTLATSSLL